MTADPGVLERCVGCVQRPDRLFADDRTIEHLLVAPVACARDSPLWSNGDRACQGRPKSQDYREEQRDHRSPLLKLFYQASQAGVKLDLIVRGACGLRAGVPGLSENIHVRSIVGRFLEHSRAYHFENGGHPELYLGSADLMERNLDRRVETLVPVRDAGIARHMRDVVFDAYLRDTESAYVLVDRDYERVEPEGSEPPFNAQESLLSWYANAPLEEEPPRVERRIPRQARNALISSKDTHG